MFRFLDLKDKSCQEAYRYFDENIRPLPKNPGGTFKETIRDYVDTDVDAFRHAFVSGAYTQEYGGRVADILGSLNEITSFASDSTGGAGSKNMDLWNNAVGRKYGLKTKSLRSLAQALHKAMQNGEMILNLEDKRKFRGSIDYQASESKPVIVLQESKTGRNELFFDTLTHESMSRNKFVKKIRSGMYPGYRVINLYGKATPVSVPDDSTDNNLG